jgi:hypothetical protein
MEREGKLVFNLSDSAGPGHFFESCSHQGFSTILHSFPFATFSCTASAVYSGHKLATRIWGEPLG